MSETEAPLKRTPLHQTHVDLGARMVPFGGWSMPVQYSGVVDEHVTVRTKVGLFDVSHMGEVELRGPRALEVANELITNDLSKAVDGQAIYTAMCKPDGGIVDDLVVYRFSSEHVFICVNAANREKDFAWMQAHVGGRCDLVDRGDEFAQIAVQGPNAFALVQALTPAPLAGVGTYRFTTGPVAGIDAIISRTGYTGEDGFELYVAADRGPALWAALTEAGQPFGVKPAGLGARDALRLEMKYALYGNDIDETTHPLEAGLGWVTKLDKPHFVGRDALLAIKAAGVTRKLVGLELTGRGIARHGYPVVSPADGAKIGEITSGTMGPSLEKAIAMAYVPAALSTVGTRVDVEIRGKPVEARVAKTPFLVGTSLDKLKTKG
jgi:aminomethyltransferase